MRQLLIAVVLVSACFAGNTSVYDFTLSSIEGQAAPLAAYKGKVLLMVNVASKCGFTPQYEALEGLYEKYKTKGLVVLGFPANNFLSQEPGTNSEIKDFCERTYHVKFPMYSKISVKGDDKAPLYHFLTEKETNPTTSGEIKWNFTKFLVSKDGRILARFEPAVKPDSPEVIAAIEKALGE
jgi:glutathione peroxidase